MTDSEKELREAMREVVYGAGANPINIEYLSRPTQRWVRACHPSVIKVLLDELQGWRDQGEKSTKFITVYRAFMTDGYTNWPSGLYRTYQEALERSDFPDSQHTKPFKVKAIEDPEGQIWLVDGPYEFTLDKEAKKQAALAKLTDEEKKALGL